ncbi:hypothetical protein OUZ56_025526 [Daphnia magna]|uniref:Uncharacterized protein n=1 Tax=Daphnia magna TaxID=35525 RepID=A0ABQ9ZK45_9CRUS|nr:hypothetical protein OUZ56_025526 [Daphnia magna]
MPTNHTGPRLHEPAGSLQPPPSRADQLANDLRNGVEILHQTTSKTEKSLLRSWNGSQRLPDSSNLAKTSTPVAPSTCSDPVSNGTAVRPQITCVNGTSESHLYGTHQSSHQQGCVQFEFSDGNRLFRSQLRRRSYMSD